MTTGHLFDPGPAARAPASTLPDPAPTPATARKPPRAPREWRDRTRPRNVLKVRCSHGCGYTGKVPLDGGLRRYGELMRCPDCNRVASIEVNAFVSR